MWKRIVFLWYIDRKIMCYIALVLMICAALQLAQVSTGRLLQRHDENKQAFIPDRGATSFFDGNKVDYKPHEDPFAVTSYETKSREKRWVGSVIMSGLGMLMKATMAGVTISNAVTGGCSVYPSICENRNIISTLEEEIEGLETTYTEDLVRVKKLVLFAIDISTNNQYIQYYINQIVQSASTIEATYRIILNALQEQFAFVENEERFDSQTDTLEYSLSDLESIIDENKDTQLLGFAMQLLVDFTQRGLATNFTSIGRARNMDDFKLQLNLSLSGVPTKLGNIKSAIRSENEAVDRVTANRTQVFRAVRASLSTIGDGVGIAVTSNRWKTVAEKMRTARNTYEAYRTELENAIDSLREVEQAAVATIGESASAFETLVTKFTGIIHNVTKFGYTAQDELQLPINYSAPLFTTTFSQSNQFNLASKQSPVIAFLKDTQDNFTRLDGQLRAREALLEFVTEAVNRSDSLSEMYSTLKMLYSYDTSPDIVAFGDALTEPSVMCIVTMLNQHIAMYDFYDLRSWKPLCDVSGEQFRLIKQQAMEAKSRDVLHITINDVASDQEFDDESLVDLLDVIKLQHDMSNDDALVKLGRALVGRDVICAVAEQFPNRQTYAFYDLVALRSSCGVLTQTDFDIITEQVNDIERTYAYVKADLGYCTRRGMGSYSCLCIDELAADYGISAHQVKYWMKKARPDLERYCGDSIKCDCEDLSN